MSVVHLESIGNQARQMGSETDGQTSNANVIPLRPEGGFLYPGKPDPSRVILPEYSSVILPEESQLLDQGKSVGFSWELTRETTSDGVQFKVARFEPVKRRTNLGMFIDTPWGTQVEGLNSHLGALTARTGVPSIVKGPEEGTSIKLSHSAFITHALMNSFANDGYVMPNYFMHKGFSRGAMIGFGVGAYAPSQNNFIVYAERDDPCIAHSVLELIAEDVKDYLEYVPKEAITMAGHILGIALDPRRLKHYRKTVDISINGLTQFIRTGIPLFNAEAGELAQHTPYDANMTVIFQKGMPANHSKDFKNRLAGRPGVVVKEVGGTHTRNVGRKPNVIYIDRLDGLVTQLEAGVEIKDIDYTKVHLHKAA